MRIVLLPVCLILLTVAALPAQEITTNDYYFKYIAERDALRQQHPISTEAGRAGFMEAIKPLRDAIATYLQGIDYANLREDHLYYYAQLAFNAGNYELTCVALEKYLERYPRGNFADMVRKELYERYTLMDGKVAEARTLQPVIEANLTSDFFKTLINMTWALNRAGNKEETLAVHRRILDEAIRRAGREKLPDYYMARALPAVFELMVEMGKRDEALQLLDESIAALSAAPAIKDRLMTVRNAINIITAPAPELSVERWVNGAPVKMADLRGKVVLIDYWATWCGPCQRVYPELNEIQAAYPGGEVVVLGLTKYYGRYKTRPNLSKDEESEAIVADYVPEWKLNWPLGIADSDTLFTDYGVTALPTLFIIDKEGNIRERLIGHTPEHKEIMFATVKKLLAE